ncbi:MAG: nitroreductase family protein [Candidatus Altiarchaeota archaeon]
MDVKDAIRERRAYRALEHADVTDDLIRDLAESARLSPSCFNKQPWRFVFVHNPDTLEKMHPALSQGNEWAKSASMMIAVFSRKEDDCIIKDREYHLFDVGMSVALIMLRATELGLVAHPIAGYDPETVSNTLNIPEEYNVITLIIVGRHSRKIPGGFAEHQVQAEKERPERIPLTDFAYADKYGKPVK